MVPASTYGLEMLALSELHQHKLQACENNWIRRIAGVIVIVIVIVILIVIVK